MQKSALSAFPTSKKSVWFVLKAAKVPSWRRPSPHTMVWGNGGGAAAHAAAQAVTAIVDGELLLASLASKLGWCCWLNETSAACDFGGINERGSANGLRPHKVAATSFGIVVWLTEQRLEAAHHWAATGGGGAAVCCLCNLRLVGRSLPPSYVGTIHRRHWTCDQGHRGHTWFSSFFSLGWLTLMRAFWIDEYGSSHVKKRLGFEPHEMRFSFVSLW